MRLLKNTHILLLSLLLVLPQCSGNSRTIEKVEHIETSHHESPEFVESTDKEHTHKEVHVVEVEKEEEDSGVLGSVFGALGDIIAFPFRLVGSAIDLLF